MWYKPFKKVVSLFSGILHINLCTAAAAQCSIADGLRDMQGLAARFFGGRSAAEPGVARTTVE